MTNESIKSFIIFFIGWFMTETSLIYPIRKMTNLMNLLSRHFDSYWTEPLWSRSIHLPLLPASQRWTGEGERESERSIKSISWNHALGNFRPNAVTGCGCCGSMERGKIVDSVNSQLSSKQIGNFENRNQTVEIHVSKTTEAKSKSGEHRVAPRVTVVDFSERISCCFSF
jgi:hypothetical protein